MALSSPRLTARYGVPGVSPIQIVQGPIADDVVIYAGAMVSKDSSGYFRPARTNTTDVALGRARQTYDNTVVGHAAGALSVQVEAGVFYWKNSGSSDEIAGDDVGATAYVVDDETVALTNGSSSRGAAGRIIAVDTDGFNAGQVAVAMIIPGQT